MLLALLLASSADLTREKVVGQRYAAIWADLYLNAMIGNGNKLAWLWSNAGSDDPDARDHHIRALACHSYADHDRCTFILLRDGGVATAFGEPAPDRLSCEAVFRRFAIPIRFGIKHLPPARGGGHSRTTMRCTQLPQA